MPVTNEVGTPFRKHVRIAKVDEVTHTAYGIATSEAVDCDNEIADYDGSKDAFVEWSNDFLARTTAAGQDASLGNIRLMHSLEVGGKVVKIDYNDDRKEVWLTTSPANSDVWEMLKGGYLTGYSIGGKVVKRKKEGDYSRYWFKLSEVSYVDNPANPEATFAYVKADGSVELRKFQPKPGDHLSQIADQAKTNAKSFSSALTANDLWEGSSPVQPKGDTRVMSATQNPLFSPEQLAQIQQVFFKAEGKTKRVAGEDLPASAFAWVGSKDDPSTWKLPLHFSSEEKSKRHVRNALARYGQTKDIPEDEKSKVYAKIVAAAKKYGVDVTDEEKKAKAVLEFFKSLLEKEIKKSVLSGKSETVLEKGMYQIGLLSNVLQDLAFLYMLNMEDAIWEEDDRDDAIAVELSAAVEHLVLILKDIVDEETSELIPALKAAQLEIQTLKGEASMEDEVIDIASELAGLAKEGHSLKAHFKKMASHHEKMAAQHEKMAAHHEGVVASHDAMQEAHKAAMGKSEDAMGGFHKAGAAHHKDKAAHHGGLHKAHGKLAEQHKAASEHCKAMSEKHDGGISEGDSEKAARIAAEKVATEKAAAEAAAKAATTTAPATNDVTALLLEEFKKLNSGFATLQKSVEEIAAQPITSKTPVTSTPGVEVPRTVRPNGLAKSATADVGI